MEAGQNTENNSLLAVEESPDVSHLGPNTQSTGRVVGKWGWPFRRKSASSSEESASHLISELDSSVNATLGSDAVNLTTGSPGPNRAQWPWLSLMEKMRQRRRSCHSLSSSSSCSCNSISSSCVACRPLEKADGAHNLTSPQLVGAHMNLGDKALSGLSHWGKGYRPLDQWTSSFKSPEGEVDYDQERHSSKVEDRKVTLHCWESMFKRTAISDIPKADLEETADKSSDVVCMGAQPMYTITSSKMGPRLSPGTMGPYALDAVLEITKQVRPLESRGKSVVEPTEIGFMKHITCTTSNQISHEN